VSPPPNQVGTIDVVLYAKEHWPGTNFALTLGMDGWMDGWMWEEIEMNPPIT
jgi:hypothetical protein